MSFNVNLQISDSVFRRYLMILLEDNGYNVTFSEKNGVFPEESHVIISNPIENPLIFKGFPVIYVGYKEEFKGFKTKEKIVYRPFEEEKFLEILKSVIENKADDGGFLTLNERKNKAFYRGKSVNLTEREMEILKILIKNRGKTVSRAEIEKALDLDGAESNVIVAHITYLRKKLENITDKKVIENIRSCGYVLKI